MQFEYTERVIDPEQGITQGALASYYVVVARSMLPHVVDRPLSLVGRGGAVPHPTIHDERGLMGLVEEFALEIRTSTAHASNLEHPDRLVFELEPGENVTFGAVARAAKVLRALLQGIDLESFAMTRGQRGVDVIVPVKPELDAPSLHRFGTLVIDTLVAAAPTLYTSKHDVPRRNLIRLDTAPAFVAPYSTQLLTNAPIALPAFWHELEELEPTFLTPVEVARRLQTLAGDPWEAMTSLEQRITRDHESSLAHALHSAGS
jgi:bifunctional non-homologous end joining protein LigD